MSVLTGHWPVRFLLRVVRRSSCGVSLVVVSKLVASTRSVGQDLPRGAVKSMIEFQENRNIAAAPLINCLIVVTNNQFKWHHGSTESRPQDAIGPDVYFCPYSGETAPPDQWLTEEQAGCARRLSLGEGMRLVQDELRQLERSTTAA